MSSIVEIYRKVPADSEMSMADTRYPELDNDQPIATPRILTIAKIMIMNILIGRDTLFLILMVVSETASIHL